MARALHMAVRKRIYIAAAVLLALGIALAIYREVGERRNLSRGTTLVRQKPEAPPDLEKLRATFSAGIDALAHKDGAEAAKQLGSFTFGKRGVEEYRLWFLSQAQQLAKDHEHARVALRRGRRLSAHVRDGAGGRKRGYAHERRAGGARERRRRRCPLRGAHDRDQEPGAGAGRRRRRGRAVAHVARARPADQAHA